MEKHGEKFLLVTLKLRAWSGRKFDRSETDDLGNRRNTHAARVNKQLPGDKWLSQLTTHDSLIRREFYRLTLATDVTSVRLLPEQARERFETSVHDLLAQRQDIVSNMIETYPGEIESAPLRLGDMFDIADFPTQAALREKYGASVGYLPAPASWKMGVGNGKVAKAADDARTQMLETAHNDAWERITDNLENLIEKIEGYLPAGNGKKAEGVFRDSLIENISTMTDTLRTLNVFGDPALDSAIHDMETRIASMDPALLREDAIKRTYVTDLAREIIKSRLNAKLPDEEQTIEPEQKPEQKSTPVVATKDDKADDENYFDL